MSKAPSIKSSAQARLLIYRLFTVKLSEAERQFVSPALPLWEINLLRLEEELSRKNQNNFDKTALEQAFAHIDHATREGLQRQIERLTGQSLWLGVHATQLLESFIDEHLSLIKSVQREHLDKIGFLIKRGIREGRMHKELTKDIRQITDLSKRRAQLIARNAPLQYSGALTRHHQTSSGIKRYRWQTSQDERVRESHRSRNNKIYNWDDSGHYPRSEVNCRCDAIPMLEVITR